jgi:DNA-binding XRE family transcriptional regulator
VLTDGAYAAHLAAAAEAEARAIGQRVRELRQVRGLTGKELAARAGISAQTLSPSVI